MEKYIGYQLPDDFLIGTANSAFQSEGAWDRDGKSESVMEYYAREFAGKPTSAKRGNNEVYSADLPDKGCFFYDNYEAYIDDMAKTGQTAYRLSIAWPRVIPTGFGAVNPKGIEFYNKVIDKLLSVGITPFVDINHWDMPQCLMEKGGFASPQFPEWFEAFAKVCFEAFGDRVKLWSTFNEADIAVTSGYYIGTFPPFKKDAKLAFLAIRNCLEAHFRAVRLYKSMDLGGKIGAVNCCAAIAPASFSDEDMLATKIQYEYRFDMWLSPMLEGRFPETLRTIPLVKENLPEDMDEMLRKWFVKMDFVGINYYVARRTAYDPEKAMLSTAAPSFYSTPGQQYAPYPAGLFDVVSYVQERYGNPEMYITENGCALPNINDPEKECDDPERVAYLREHLRMCVRTVRAGANLKGYFYWNDADSYEELDGYRLRFGMTWVDHETGERIWKKSRCYFSDICKTRRIN